MTRRSGSGGRRGARGPSPPGAGLFRDIVLAPDREVVPDARPLVSVADEDEREFRVEVARRRVDEYVLTRRGVELGRVAELDPAGLLGPRPRRRRREALEAERWVAARPILLPGAAEAVRASLLAEDVGGLHRTLSEPAGLRAHVRARAGRLEPRYRVVDEAAPLLDPERDLARVRMACGDVDDLWLKTGRLSTHPGDASLRLRASFGVEGDDDASADEVRHALVAELACRALPGARALAGLDELTDTLARHVGGPVLQTQQIAYWNAPQGGTRFHHDAFGDDEDDQRGVVYAQLTGRTVWLALSIEELGGRVREFVALLEEGDAPWVREQAGERWSAVQAAVERRASTLHELALPGCGVFGAFVDGPEFTGYLVDAGHALALRPGDVLLLPNHGRRRTAMHAVFCGGEEVGYALSVALRRAAPA